VQPYTIPSKTNDCIIALKNNTLLSYKQGRSSYYTPELLRESKFQPQSLKPFNRHPQTYKTVQMTDTPPPIRFFGFRG